MRRRWIAAAVVVAATAGWAGPADASHVHSKEVRPGVCVLLARNGGEKNVDLPGDEFAGNVDHALHRHVHRGEPGTNFDIGVYGTPSDPCFDGGRYLNR